MFLFKSPHINHDLTTRPEQSAHLLHSLQPPTLTGEVMDDSDGNDSIKRAISEGEIQIVSHQHLVTLLPRTFYQRCADIHSNF